MTFQDTRFGSADFADAAMLRHAGLYRKDGLYIGSDVRGRHCYDSDLNQSPILITGGARSGKTSLIAPMLIDGYCSATFIVMDWKRQLGDIAALQVKQNRRVIKISRDGGQRVNPTSHIVPSSPTQISDSAKFSESWLPYSGDARAEYFEGTAQRTISACTIVRSRMHGYVTLPMLADTLAGLGAATEEWLAFEFEISQQPEPQIRQVAYDLAALRSGDSDSGGFAGIKNEIAKSFACMLDPQLRAMFSPPFDFCFSEPVAHDAPPYMVFIQEQLEFAKTSAPVIRAIYNCALTYKRRAISARPQIFLLDEIGNVAPWPLAGELASYAPGYGVKSVFVVQSSAMLDNLIKQGSDIITNSCGVQIRTGIRSLKEANLTSSQLGKSTLDYDDTLQQAGAKDAARQALIGAVTGQGSIAGALMTIAHKRRAASHKTKMARNLRNPDELLNTPSGNAFVFMPGILEKPFLATVPQYWKRRDLAGKYLTDRFHTKKPGHVEVATWLGQRTRKIITEPVPRKYADWPQYRESGLWSYVKGYRP